MTTALQMPVRTEAAQKVGKRLFRKQVLRVGEIQHDGERLSFTRPYLESLVEAFNAGAYDQVPFVLADDQNRHTEDPNRFRGEVKALELSGDGLDAVIELSKDGAELIEKNPRLGVSARIVEGLDQSDGRSFPRAVRHVCGTLDPVVTRLQDWEPVSVRSLTQTSDQKVIDLTASRYMPDKLTDEQIQKLNELPEDSDARKALATLLDGKAPEAKDDDKPDPDKKQRGLLKRLLGIKDDAISDDDLTTSFEKLLDDSKVDEPDEADKDKTPETANLSKEAKDAIDLATTRAANAESSVKDLSTQLAESKWALERKEYEDAGVPPVLLDLAAPVMTSPGKTIDLSNGDKTDPRDLMRKMLDEAKGTIDLSTVGSSKDNEEKAEAKDLASNEKWGASI